MYTEKIRIYPNKTQIDTIDRILWNCKELYNYFLELNKLQYKKDKTFLWKFDLIAKIKSFNFTCTIYEQVKQNVAARMDYSLSRIKTGNKFPKFKSFKQYQSFTYPQSKGFKLDLINNRIRLGKFGSIKAIFSRKLKGTPKTCTIKKFKSGNYYAFITIDDKGKEKEKVENRKPFISFDLGVSKFLTDQDGNYISSPRFLRKNLKKLAKAQRELSRKQKGSRNRRKARIKVAKLHEKVYNCRRDFHFKVAYYLVTNYNEIYCEDLRVKTMFPGKSRQAKKARRALYDVALYSFLVVLQQMCIKYNCTLTKVDPQYTSQICNNCGAIVKKTLEERVHNCPHCGLVIDRDVNAARNILQRGKNLSVGTTGGATAPQLVEMLIPGV